jgi:hypothetical protein
MPNKMFVILICKIKNTLIYFCSFWIGKYECTRAEIARVI